MRGRVEEFGKISKHSKEFFNNKEARKRRLQSILNLPRKLENLFNRFLQIIKPTVLQRKINPMEKSIQSLQNDTTGSKTFLMGSDMTGSSSMQHHNFSFCTNFGSAPCLRFFCFP